MFPNTIPEGDGESEFSGPELLDQIPPLPLVESACRGVEENPAEFDIDGTAASGGREGLHIGKCSADGGLLGCPCPAEPS